MPEEPVKAAPEKKYGFVAVCAGQGLEAVFRDLGVDGSHLRRTDHGRPGWASPFLRSDRRGLPSCCPVLL